MRRVGRAGSFVGVTVGREGPRGAKVGDRVEMYDRPGSPLKSERGERAGGEPKSSTQTSI